MLVKSTRACNHLTNLEETFNVLDKYRMKLNTTKCTFGVFFCNFLGFLISSQGIEANLKKIQGILQLQPQCTTQEMQRLIGKVLALSRFISRSTNKCLSFFKTLCTRFAWTDECATMFTQLKESQQPAFAQPPPLGRLTLFIPCHE